MCSALGQESGARGDEGRREVLRRQAIRESRLIAALNKAIA